MHNHTNPTYPLTRAELLLGVWAVANVLIVSWAIVL